jgi:hypothetical protein
LESSEGLKSYGRALCLPAAQVGLGSLVDINQNGKPIGILT